LRDWEVEKIRRWEDGSGKKLHRAESIAQRVTDWGQRAEGEKVGDWEAGKLRR
jgi:hypothetical protein